VILKVIAKCFKFLKLIFLNYKYNNENITSITYNLSLKVDYFISFFQINLKNIVVLNLYSLSTKKIQSYTRNDL